MISERQVAKGFQALWNEVIPLLTPHFVHLFNEAYCRALVISGETMPFEVPSRGDTDSAVVSEFAFHLVRLAHQRNIRMSDVAHDRELMSDAETEALSLIREYERRTDRIPQVLNDSERAESLLLVRNYDVFLSSRADETIQFSPSIPGAGFVDQCAGDLSIGASLFEVKTVSRNIAGKDIRQLLVYLALQAATGQRRWSKGGFFNPRRGRVYEFSVDKVIPLMSGGRVAAEVFSEMIEYFCTRDIELDIAF